MRLKEWWMNWLNRRFMRKWLRNVANNKPEN